MIFVIVGSMLFVTAQKLFEASVRPCSQWSDCLPMQPEDARILRSMAVDYRRQAEATTDRRVRRHLLAMAAYCEELATAIDNRLKKSIE